MLSNHSVVCPLQGNDSSDDSDSSSGSDSDSSSDNSPPNSPVRSKVSHLLSKYINTLTIMLTCKFTCTISHIILIHFEQFENFNNKLYDHDVQNQLQKQTKMKHYSK